MKYTQHCRSIREVEVCAVLDYNENGEYVHVDGCGYADDLGRCHYRFKEERNKKQWCDSMKGQTKLEWYIKGDQS